MANKIQLRRDSAANWAAFNPVLADGELGIDTTNGYAKFGDGVSTWNECMYLRFPGVGPDNLSITGTPGGGAVGEAYSFVPTITGGVGAKTVASIGAALPSGTSLNTTTGAITGTLSGSAATYAGIILRVTDADGNVATLNLAAIVVAAAPVTDSEPPTISGTVTTSNVQATTATISWPAGSDNVAVTGYRHSRDGGTTWVTVGNVLTANLTGLTASTTYALQVQARDAAGNWSTSISGTLNTSAPAADSRARFGYGTATAGVSNPEALLASMTAMTGSGNASKAGSFSSTVPTGQYGWAAFEATASASGVTFTDPLGTGGWQGATSSGNNAADPGNSPNTSTVTAVINGVTWRFFRQNYASASGQFTTS